MTRCQGFLTQSVCGAPNHHLRNRIAALNAGHDLATPRRGHDVHKLPARLLWCPEVYHRATQYQHKTAVRRYAMSALPINFLSDDDPAEPVDTREPATCLDEAAMVDAKHKPVRNGTHSCLSGVRMVEFVSLCELRSQSEDVWRSLAQEKDLVVTSNGKPIAISAVLRRPCRPHHNRCRRPSGEAEWRRGPVRDPGGGHGAGGALLVRVRRRCPPAAPASRVSTPI